MGIIFKMYSNESRGGKYPAMSVFATGRDGMSMYPEYLTDVKLLICPSNAETSKEDFQTIFDIAAQSDPDGLWNSFAPAPFATNPHVRDLVFTQLLGRRYSYAYLPWAANNDGSLFGLANGWNWVRNNKCGGGAVVRTATTTTTSLT